MNRLLTGFSNVVGAIKKVAGLASCIAKAGEAFHQEYQVQFPPEVKKLEKEESESVE